MKRHVLSMLMVMLLVWPSHAELLTVRELMEACNDPAAVTVVVDQLAHELDPDGWSAVATWDEWLLQPSSWWWFFGVHPR